MAGFTGNFLKDCMYSTVKNTAGSARTFSFLPPHGVQLANNATYTVFGSIYEAVNMGGDRIAGERNRQALANALQREDLTILATPSPILLDATTQANKILKLNNGSLSFVDPCWLTSDSNEDYIAA